VKSVETPLKFWAREPVNPRRFAAKDLSDGSGSPVFKWLTNRPVVAPHGARPLDGAFAEAHGGSQVDCRPGFPLSGRTVDQPP